MSASTPPIPLPETPEEKRQRGIRLRERIDFLEKNEHSAWLLAKIKGDRDAAHDAALNSATIPEARTEALHRYWALEGILETIGADRRRAGRLIGTDPEPETILE